MEQIIIHQSALSLVEIANLKEFNREHKPVVVTVVDNDGYSKRFKVYESELRKYIDIDIPTLPTSRLIVIE